MLKLLANTIFVGAASTAVAMVFGFAAALWTAGLGRRMSACVTALSVAALALPPFLATNCWIDLLGQNGAWRGWLPLNIYTLGGTVWILALLTWPITYLTVLAAWRRIESSQLEVDPMLRGAALIRWLLVPSARAVLGQAAVLTLVLSINNFAVPAILQVKVLPAELWVSFNTTFNYGAALMLCWPLIVIPLAGLLLLRRADISWNWRAEHASAQAFRKQLGAGWSRGAAVVSFVVLTLSVGAPLWRLAASGNTWKEFIPAVAAGRAALAHSVLFAAATATLVIVPGILLGRRVSLSWAWIALFAPGVLLGIGLIWLFNRPGLEAIYQSSAIVILAYIIRYAAPGWNCVSRALNSTDRTLADAARMEGANFFQMIRHVYWPQISRQAAAGWYVVYLLCLWDVEALVLIVPPGDETLSLRIFNLLHYGHNTQVNALCLTLVFLAVAPLLLWRLWAMRLSWTARALPALLLTSTFLAGCSQKGGTVSTPVKSRFFSEVQIIGRRGTALGQFNKPRSVAVDTNDNIFVIDMTGRLQKFSPSGEYLSSWQMPQTDTGKPKGMCTDRDGNIVLVEPHYTRVNHFSTDGKLVAQWGVKGTNAGQLAFPRSAAVNSKGEIYVSEYSAVERVQKFTVKGGAFIKTFGIPGKDKGQLDRVEGMGVDSKDRLYLADSCNHRIQVFSAEDKFLRTYGKAGSGLGELSYPYDIRVDGAGNQYVCEFGNSRIQIFDTNDLTIEILGGPGAEPGQFNNPWSICLDSKGNLLVADAMNHRVQKFIRKGGT